MQAQSKGKAVPADELTDDDGDADVWEVGPVGQFGLHIASRC